jgi:DNA-binding MarR family transcriptional regulator
MSTAERLAPSGLTAAESGAWRGLLRTHAGLVKELDGELEAAHGLGLSSCEVLLRLEASAGRRMRMCELAEAAVLSRSGLTRLVDRLERDGFVARDSCEDDARGASPC